MQRILILAMILPLGPTFDFKCNFTAVAASLVFHVALQLVSHMLPVLAWG